MFRGILTTAVMLTLASLAIADEPGRIEQAPEYGLARIDSDGNLLLSSKMAVPDPQDDQNRICETVQTTLKLDQVKGFEIDGKVIPSDQLKDRFKADTIVLISGNNEMIPNYYAQLYNQGTIVLAVNAASPANLVTRPTSMAAQNFQRFRPPMFVFASREGTGPFKIRQLVEYSFNFTGRKYQTRSAGEPRSQVETLMISTRRESTTFTIAAEDLELFGAKGSALSLDQFCPPFSQELVVVYSADGQPVDPIWLRSLKPTTLVFVGPELPCDCKGRMPVIRYDDGQSIPLTTAPTSVPTSTPPPAESDESKTQTEELIKE